MGAEADRQAAVNGRLGWGRRPARRLDRRRLGAARLRRGRRLGGETRRRPGRLRRRGRLGEQTRRAGGGSGGGAASGGTGRRGRRRRRSRQTRLGRARPGAGSSRGRVTPAGGPPAAGADFGGGPRRRDGGGADPAAAGAAGDGVGGGRRRPGPGCTGDERRADRWRRRRRAGDQPGFIGPALGLLARALVFAHGATGSPGAAAWPGAWSGPVPRRSGSAAVALRAEAGR